MHFDKYNAERYRCKIIVAMIAIINRSLLN